ncbi:alpha/beta hydrolase [Erysipelothrix larvae]|uniref:alpha/beta hydrolase n=1 Tax=Erysipelothrix larvae TaxID=1514105 RepID=UPI00098E88E9|nr:alpha/beta hydrolase-fold protein [Erysipelothrix larvae]
MAKLSVDYYSNALKRHVELTVLLPVDALNQQFKYEDLKPFKTLYLLHGMLGNRHDWIDRTLLHNYLEGANIAVVMPSGENSMYVNNALSNVDYSAWIGDELVSMTRRMFPLSPKREDTYIAGLSMGGFGSLMNGLKYRDVFSVIGSFSAPIQKSDDLKKNYSGINMFGMSYQAQFEENPSAFDIYQMLDQNQGDIPYLYLSCGSRDFLIENNREFVKYVASKNIHHEYFELDDDHSWTFWDESIKRFIAYLKR